MPLKAVIFDMDGTMVDSMPYHEAAWHAFFKSKGMAVSEEEFHRINHGTLYDMMPRVFGEHLSKQESYQLGMEKEKVFRELYAEKMTPVSGLLQWLEKLRVAGLQIGLATAADFTNVDFVVDRLKIRDYFSAIVTSDIIAEGKPSPAVYLHIAKMMEIEPQHCLVFEDTPTGIAAAVAAGMKVIGITTGMSKTAMQQLPVSMVISDYGTLNIGDLEPLFNSL